MRSLVVRNNISVWANFGVIGIFVCLLLIIQNDALWYGLAAFLLLLQIRFKFSVSTLLPIIGVLSLTEYFFSISGKRVYLAEIIYIPLFINFVLTSFIWKPLNRIGFIVLVLISSIILFQGINYLVNSDLISSFFRVRSFALPLFLIVIVDSQIRTREDLMKIVKIILLVALISSVVVYLQFFTGQFYILQNNSVTSDDLNFIEGYLSSTQDSFLFNLIGLQIKGPMPPVGLNYFKFGYSETIIVAASLFLSLYRFRENKKGLSNFFFFLFVLFATLLTGSRSVLLAFLFIGLIINWFYKQRLKWNVILIIIISFFVVTYLIGPLLNIINLEEFGTLASRMFYMDDFFKFIGKHPEYLLAGSSPYTFLDLTNSGQPPHHFFAFGVIYDGIIITVLVFYSLYRLLKSSRQLYTADKELSAIGFGLWASIFGFVFIYGQTSYLTWSTPHNMFYCIIIGLLIATRRICKQQQALHAPQIEFASGKMF